MLLLSDLHLLSWYLISFYPMLLAAVAVLMHVLSTTATFGLRPSWRRAIPTVFRRDG